MRVVLVNPPQTELRQPRAYIPLGLGYLGATLEEAGVDVEVLNLAGERDLSRVNYPKADWFGVTCTTATYTTVKKLVPYLASRGLVALGGVQPTLCPQETLLATNADVVFVGEAEYAFRDAVVGKPPSNQIIQAGLIKNLDALPFPARHLFPDSDVVDRTGIHGQEPGVPATTVITSRGCPYHCRFCCKGHPMFYTYRYRSADNVYEELVEIKERYGVEHVRFVDDEFTLNEQRTADLMRRIDPLGLTWVCITRADTLTPIMLKLMKKAGCEEVHLGVETGSKWLLDSMNKGMTVEQQLRGIEMVKAAGIKVKAYLMWNYPGETEADMDATVEFIRRAQPDKFTLSKFQPLPGSWISEFVPKGEQWFYPDDDPGFVEFRERIKAALE